MLRNFRTVYPIFTKIASKVVQDLKEKSRESAVHENVAKRRGGVDTPPVLLGLKETKFACIFITTSFSMLCTCISQKTMKKKIHIAYRCDALKHY